MEKRYLILRNVANVAASKTAVIDVPIGPRYHSITLAHGYASGTNTIAAAATNITEIRVIVNGTIVRQFSGTQLRDFNLLNGTAYDCLGVPNTAPGVTVPLFFAEPWRGLAVDRDALAWKTNLWNSFRIEVDLSSASTPTLTGSAIVDDMKAKTNEPITKIIRQTLAAAGTSYDIATMDRRGWLQQLSVYPDSGGSNTATKIIIRRNGTIVTELPYADNKQFLTQNNMTPVASGRTATIFDVVFDHDDLLASSLQLEGAQDVSITIEAGGTMSSSQTYLYSRLENL